MGRKMALCTGSSRENSQPGAQLHWRPHLLPPRERKAASPLPGLAEKDSRPLPLRSLGWVPCFSASHPRPWWCILVPPLCLLLVRDPAPWRTALETHPPRTDGIPSLQGSEVGSSGLPILCHMKTPGSLERIFAPCPPSHIKHWFTGKYQFTKLCMIFTQH